MGCGNSKNSIVAEPDQKNRSKEGEDIEVGEEFFMEEEADFQQEGIAEERMVEKAENSVNVNTSDKNIKKRMRFQPLKSEILGKYSSSKKIIYYKNSLKHHLTSSNVTNDEIEPLTVEKPYKLLYFFDFKKGYFHYCDLEKSDSVDWLSKKLHIEGENLNLPYFKTNYHISQTELFSYCQISDTLIAIVGGYNPLYSFVEYDFKENTFQKKSFEISLRALPNLIAFDGILCTIGGNKGDEYCCDFDIYDIKREKWVEMTPLPTPHFGGCCYTFKKKSPCQNFIQIKHDLYIAGGSSSISKVNNYNGVIDKFNFDKMTWESMRMEDIFNVFKVPRFIETTCCAQVDGKKEIVFLNEERTGGCYLNSKNKKLKKLGKFEVEEKFEKKGFPVKAVYSRGQVYSVSHDYTEEEDRRVKIHCLDLMTGKWKFDTAYLANT